MKTSEVLNLAADAIETRGWTQAGDDPWGMQDPTGPVCLEGGIAAVLGIDCTHPEGAHLMGAGYEDLVRCPAYRSVKSYLAVDRGFLFSWNDARGRTQAEVIEVLRATAVIEAARESELAEVNR